MSQVIQLQGSMISSLAQLVKKVGDQQKEIIMELSDQLGRHNELIEKAIEKQSRMDTKINRIEQKLMEKEILNYRKIQVKLEKRKEKELERERLRELQKLEELKESHRNGQHQDIEEDDDEDQYESCDEDEEKLKIFSKSSNDLQKTGDPLKDFYLDIHNIQSKEDKKYAKIGRDAMLDFVKQLNPDLWRLEKHYLGCDLYRKEGGSTYPCFRIETTFDFPPELVFENIRQSEKRTQWDQNYEELKVVKEYQMNTQLYFVKMKAQWPLGNRELLLCFQAIPIEPRTFYISGRSTTHREFPENDKSYRVNTTQGSYVISPLSDGKQTKLVYITEFDFKGSIPKYMIQKAGSASFIEGLNKMKKLLQQNHPEQKYESN